MRIIGLTGPSGAGKGAVGARLIARSIPVIDTDRVYHELLVPPSACLDALVEAFGEQIRTADGQLDRTVLAALVFGVDEAAKERHLTLNRISHRFVIERTGELLDAYRQSGVPLAVIDAPLLLEAGMDAICDVVVAVLAEEETRLARLLARDGKSREALLARLRSQPDDDFYRSRADFVIENNRDPDALNDAVDDLLGRLEATV